MEIRLEDDIAIVTGAANGIGQGVAVALAKAGARVALLDRSAEGLEVTSAKIGEVGTSRRYLVDVADPVQVDAAVGTATADFGDPTILVTAAAIDESVGIDDMSPDQWRRMIDINLNGTFYCLKAVLPGMRRRKRGRVVFFGSNIALKGGTEISHYGAAKGGVHALARCAALELAAANITVNTIAPGPVETDMLWSLPQQWLDAKRAELPLARFGRVDEIVPTVMLLVSGGGSFYTGATLNVSGGDVLQ